MGVFRRPADRQHSPFITWVSFHWGGGLSDVWEGLSAPQAHAWLHWRNFTLNSGGDQWRRQDLVSRRSRRRRREHQGAERFEVWGWVSSPQPTRGGWGSVVSSPSGVQPLSHFLHILGHRTLLVARKTRFSCPKYKEKLVFFIWIANSTLKKWWWVTTFKSHHRHIQSCAYAWQRPCYRYRPQNRKLSPCQLSPTPQFGCVGGVRANSDEFRTINAGQHYLQNVMLLIMLPVDFPKHAESLVVLIRPIGHALCRM